MKSSHGKFERQFVFLRPMRRAFARQLARMFPRDKLCTRADRRKVESNGRARAAPKHHSSPRSQSSFASLSTALTSRCSASNSTCLSSTMESTGPTDAPQTSTRSSRCVWQPHSLSYSFGTILKVFVHLFSAGGPRFRGLYAGQGKSHLRQSGRGVRTREHEPCDQGRGEGGSGCCFWRMDEWASD